jgi:hypothetical protein
LLEFLVRALQRVSPEALEAIFEGDAGRFWHLHVIEAVAPNLLGNALLQNDGLGAVAQARGRRWVGLEARQDVFLQGTSEGGIALLEGLEQRDALLERGDTDATQIDI